MFSNSLIKPSSILWLQPLLFLKWWYGKALFSVVLFALYIVASVEDFFSVIVMLKALITLQPLHQDYSLIGRGIGVVVRLLWLVAALAGLALALALALACIAFWLALPLVLVYAMSLFVI